MPHRRLTPTTLRCTQQRTFAGLQSPGDCEYSSVGPIGLPKPARLKWPK